MNQKRYSNSLKRFELILTSTNTLPSVKYVEGCLIFDLFYAMSKNQPSGPTVRSVSGMVDHDEGYL